MPQQSYYIAFNLAQGQDGSGTYAPTKVLTLAAAAITTPPSEVQTDPLAVVPVELDTRAIVIGTPVVPQASASTAPSWPSDGIVIRAAPVVFLPSDAGSGGT